jgi:hypothetical protein
MEEDVPVLPSQLPVERRKLITHQPATVHHEADAEQSASKDDDDDIDDEESGVDKK